MTEPGSAACNCDASGDPPTGHRPWCGTDGSAAVDAPTPEAAAREAVWDYLRDYPDCSITWTESAYIAQLAVEAWKKAGGHA